ncbi:hypothetical protein C7451_1019 [Blastomonas natatoria]|uniref:Uncharacterized protein n=1 Tax=Blastomonas natatoria TaxID=34015 RepID=A0A2V3VB97_9SPHN|nr:hypothetical protein [Blastomonas natatoria]PXW78947.1 hypothetical protein C7451_1019 [Blastomonas natatoria]
MSDWMTEMADIIHDVACNLVRKHGADNRGILVLADLDGGVRYSVYVGRQRFVEYIFVTEDEFTNVDLLNDLRFVPPPDKVPLGIEIFIKDGGASSKIVYPQDVPEDQLPYDDRESFVISYFGDFPIRYPPMPSDAQKLPRTGWRTKMR